MTEFEQIELRQILDDLRLNVSEAKPSRLRASFAGYVILPSALFGILGGIMAAGFISVMAVVLTYMTRDTAQSYFDKITFGSAVVVAAVVMAYAAVYLIDDWRQLQWERKTRRYFGQPKREQPSGRIITEVAPGRQVVSRLDWDLQWREKLARKVYNERGIWTGGDKPARDRHFTNPNLYPNITGNWDAAKDDLCRWGYIDDNGIWTERAKGELLARLRIV